MRTGSRIIWRAIPRGSVPALEISEGGYILQSTAVLEYLEELYPRPNMIGETPRDRAFTRDLMSLINEITIHFATYATHGNPMFAGMVQQKRDAAIAAWHLYRRRMSIPNQMAKDAPFIGGDRPTIADCSPAPLIDFVKSLYNVLIPSDCRRLQSWYERFSARPSAAPIEYPAQVAAIAQSRQGGSLAEGWQQP